MAYWNRDSIVHWLWRSCLENWVQIRPSKQSYNALRHNTYNLGQYKMEQQTPIPPAPAQFKDEAVQKPKRAIFPSLI